MQLSFCLPFEAFYESFVFNLFLFHLDVLSMLFNVQFYNCSLNILFQKFLYSLFKQLLFIFLLWNFSIFSLESPV